VYQGQPTSPVCMRLISSTRWPWHVSKEPRHVAQRSRSRRWISHAPGGILSAGMPPMSPRQAALARLHALKWSAGGGGSGSGAGGTGTAAGGTSGGVMITEGSGAGACPGSAMGVTGAGVAQPAASTSASTSALISGAAVLVVEGHEAFPLGSGSDKLRPRVLDPTAAVVLDADSLAQAAPLADKEVAGESLATDRLVSLTVLGSLEEAADALDSA
jgi:hypothetical protein